MKKVLLVASILSFGLAVSAQQPQVQQSFKKPRSLAVHLTLHDFETTENIRTSSIASVINNKQFLKMRNMAPGVTVSYMQGLTNHVDVAASLAGAMVDYPFTNRPSFRAEQLLLQADVTANVKLFTDNYYVVPYLTAGVGASKFDVYYGAYIPLGTGLQFSLGEDKLLLQAQYRAGITENTNNQLYFSLGFATTLGKKS